MTLSVLIMPEYLPQHFDLNKSKCMFSPQSDRWRFISQNKYIYSSYLLHNQTQLHFRKKSIFNILHLCNELKKCQSSPRL